MSEAPDGETIAEDTSLEPEATTEAPGDDAAAPADEGQAEQPKPRQTAQERIAELTAKRREAERDAEYWKAKALQPAQEARRPQAEAVDEDPEPNPVNYEYGEMDARYIQDVTRREARREFRSEMAAQRAQDALQAKFASFDQRVTEQFPDGEPEGLTALKSLPTLSTAITDVILASENGPRLADHLGKNTRELSRLSALPPTLQAYELAKIEQKLPTQAAAKTATDAPPPTPQVRGAGGRFTVSPATDDFAAFEKLADAAG